MKAIIKDRYVECYPTDDEVIELCRPGEGADTCIWLSMGPDGLECCYFNRPTGLEDMWRNGETTAKRDGCDTMKQFLPAEDKGKEIISTSFSTEGDLTFWLPFQKDTSKEGKDE